MSIVSQRPAPAGRFGFGRRFSLVMAGVAMVVAAAVAPHAHDIAPMAARVRPHAPQPAALAGLPLAVQAHLAAALAALALGAVLMAARKGRGFHRAAGWTWVALVAVAAGSSLFITGVNHGRLSVLHLITGWTLIVLPLAVRWARAHQVARHRRSMTGLFYGGFVINLAVAFIPGRTLWNLLLG